ncbi:anthrone oxygenase family protein [Pseudonocardia phyllosphaerae]|uniref:anthrone oxygenase family protein n=1 Tax=Pseudonocardia phyllosphaerae TaxID=3390502 RepID=UPI00397A1C4A
MSVVLAVSTVTVVGLMVGVELAVAFVVHPMTLRLPTAASLAARADGARVMGRAMPFWYIGSLVLTAVLTVLLWGTPAATATLVAVLLLTVGIVMSVVLLVPINDRSATWTADDHPADWRQQQQRWDRLHYVRVVIIVAAFVLVTVGAAMR